MASVERRVVGLYSFPKSGNTWLRAIVGSVLEIPLEGEGLQKYLTDAHYGRVIENPWNFKEIDWFFYKSHRKELLTSHMDQDFETDQVVYIYRNPLDVFMSYLNFVSTNVSPNAGRALPFQFSSVDDLSSEQLNELFEIYLEHGTIVPQNKVFGSVFEHIHNFQRRADSGKKVHIIRYEDLMDDFQTTVRKMTLFLGLRGINLKRVYEAADKRTAQNGKFFWKRQKNNYMNYLSEDQVVRFYDRHGVTMTKLGYPPVDHLS